MRRIIENPIDNTDKNDIRINVIPFKCPVCNGYGSVNYGKAVCHACEGKGYLLIDQNENKTTSVKNMA